jgi:hypothetical protein
MQEFVEGYRSFIENPKPRLEYRLDYLVLAAAAAVPGPIFSRFPHSYAVYRNTDFQVFRLQ